MANLEEERYRRLSQVQDFDLIKRYLEEEEREPKWRGSPSQNVVSVVSNALENATSTWETDIARSICGWIDNAFLLGEISKDEVQEADRLLIKILDELGI